MKLSAVSCQLSAAAMLLVGCDAGAKWTDSEALAPTVKRLDANGDGKVDQAEFERVAWKSPGFAFADVDQDAALSAEELAAAIKKVDPLDFDGADPRGAPHPKLGPGMTGSFTVEQRWLWEVLYSLRGEALAKDPAAPVPSEEALRAAIATGRVDAAATQLVLQQLRAAWTAVGLTFPEGLPIK
ncbi:MAG: hypothetical protein ACOZNI_25875 [Myxococcota bacterium]